MGKKRSDAELRRVARAQSQGALSAWADTGGILRKNIELHERLYQAKWKASDHSYSGYSKMFMPELHSQVETETALLKQLTIGTPQWYSFVGRTPDDTGRAKAVTTFIDYQLEELFFESRWERFCRTTSLHGWCLAELGWRLRKDVVTRPKLKETYNRNGGLVAAYERNDDGSLITERREEAVYDGPWFEPLTPESVMLSPSATCLEDTDYILIRKKVPWSWLKSEESAGRLGSKARGVPLSDVESIRQLPADNSSDKAVEDARKRWAGLSAGIRDKQLSEDPNVDVAMVYTRLALGSHEDDLADRVVITLVAGEVVGIQELPYWHGRWPFLLGWRIRREGTWVGYGLGEAGEGPQVAVNDLLNQGLDNGTFNLMNMQAIDRNAKVKTSSLKIRPNGVVKGDGNPNTWLTQIRVNDYTGTAQQLILTILDSWRRSVGLPATLFAQPLATERSATEITALKESAGIRPQSVARGLGQAVLTPMMSMIYALDEQYVDQPKVIRIIGKDGTEYKAEDFRELLGDYDLHVQLATEASNPLMFRAALSSLIQTVAPFGPGIVNLTAAVRALVSTYPLGAWADEIVPPDDQELMLGNLSADAENVVMGQGQPVPVRSYQPHAEHLAVHQGMLAEADSQGVKVEPKTRSVLETHIRLHKQYLSQAMSAAPPAGATKMVGGMGQMPAQTGVGNMQEMAAMGMGTNGGGLTNP